MTEETLYPHEWLLRKRVLITVLVTVATFTVLAVLVQAILASLTYSTEELLVNNEVMTIGCCCIAPYFLAAGILFVGLLLYWYGVRL